MSKEEAEVKGEKAPATADVPEDDYNEDEDEDFDPSQQAEPEHQASDASDNEPEPDYSNITTDVSHIRTRTQKYKEQAEGPSRISNPYKGIVRDQSLAILVDSIFDSLQNGEGDDWASQINRDGEPEPPKQAKKDDSGPQKVLIETSYTFAGKLVRESKLVDADSAEAKAYMNSTTEIMTGGPGDSDGPRKTSVEVVREVKGTGEKRNLRIKLKRASLIDKFLTGDKKSKLTTLEKSRLDWATFVDNSDIKDDLALHNRAGYLDKQDFLGRMDAKRDHNYQKAKELERQRQWQMQQRQA